MKHDRRGYGIITVLLLVVILTAGLSGCAKAEKRVTIGAKNYTEQYLTGEIMALLLEEAGFDVTRKFGMSSFALRQAMESQQVDLASEFTGTAWSAYFNQTEVISDPVELFEAVRRMDEQEHDMIWRNRMSYNNTYALAVTKEFSQQHSMKTLDDLADYLNANPDSLDLGLEYEFYDRPDGFFAMADEYGFGLSEKNIKTMDLGLTYDALKNGDVEATMVFSTDGNLVKYDFVVLEDTRSFFPIYNLCTVFTKEAYEQYPEMEEILSPMVDLLDQETITHLNYLVDGEGMESETVAEEFLKEQGLID